jgi:antitoxin PrlF
MYTATLSERGQITIPAKIRRRLGVGPNDKIAIIFRENEVILKPLKGTIKNLRGIIHPRKQPEDFERIHSLTKSAVAKKNV